MSIVKSNFLPGNLDDHIKHIWDDANTEFLAVAATGSANTALAAKWVDCVLAFGREYVAATGIRSVRISSRPTAASQEYPASVRLVLTVSCDGELLVKRKVALDFARFIQHPQHADALQLDLPKTDFGEEEDEQEYPMPRFFILTNPQATGADSVVVAQREWLKRLEFPRHSTIQRGIESHLAWPFAEFFGFFMMGFDGLTTSINGERPEHSPLKRRMLTAGHQVTIGITIPKADMQQFCERLDSYDWM